MAATNISQKNADNRTVFQRIPWGKIISYFVLLLFAVFYIGPILMLVNTSVNSLQQFRLNPTVPVTQPIFQNFAEAWEKANFAKYILNSLLYTAVATVVYVMSSVFVTMELECRTSSW